MYSNFSSVYILQHLFMYPRMVSPITEQPSVTSWVRAGSSGATPIGNTLEAYERFSGNASVDPSRNIPEAYERFSGNASVDPSRNIPEAYERFSGNASVDPSNNIPEAYERFSGNASVDPSKNTPEAYTIPGENVPNPTSGASLVLILLWRFCSYQMERRTR